MISDNFLLIDTVNGPTYVYPPDAKDYTRTVWQSDGGWLWAEPGTMHGPCSTKDEAMDAAFKSAQRSK